MRARTNASATRATIRTLRSQDRLNPEHAGLAQLALSTAAALDDVLLDRAGKKYAVAQMARAHLGVLVALHELEAPRATDAWDAVVAEALRPTPGIPDSEMDYSGRFD